MWREKRASRESGCVDVACPQFVHAIWEREKTRQLRHVYYAYAIGDVVTASALVLRAARGARMLTGRRDPLCLIAIVADEPIDAAETALALGNLIATHASAENGYPAEPGG